MKAAPGGRPRHDPDAAESAPLTPRDQILAATRDLLAKPDGERQFTIGRVANTAHVSRATIYRYFPNKTALLLAAGATNGAGSGAPNPRTRILDEKSGHSEDFYQCASCKSEDTFAPRDLFYPVNYDFLPVFGSRSLVIFRRHATRQDPGRSYREIREVEASWGRPIHRLAQPDSARLLETNAEIREATNTGQLLVAQTEIANAETGRRMLLEYPVKTMNIHNGRDLYQVDTGPVAFFDLSQPWERPEDALTLAFVAFNAPHFADFVLEVPTPVPGTSVQVYHYSKTRSLEATNRVYELPA